MGRLRDFGWWLRDHAGGIALVLAILACGAGAAGIVIALDAKDKAEGAGASTVPATAPTAPVDADLQGTVDELNERVAAIEESVASLREEEDTASTTTESTTTTPDDGGGDATAPDLPELPEGVDIPGLGSPESEPGN